MEREDQFVLYIFLYIFFASISKAQRKVKDVSSTESTHNIYLLAPSLQVEKESIGCRVSFYDPEYLVIWVM